MITLIKKHIIIYKQGVCAVYDSLETKKKNAYFVIRLFFNNLEILHFSILKGAIQWGSSRRVEKTET